MAKTFKITDLIPDDKNFNKGSEFGNSLIEKSFSKFGAGRSILLDKNNRIIAGNKSVENAAAIGMEDVQIVESDGKRIIAVKRTDIDLDTPEGREMALADNATAKANIIFDAELVEAELGEAVCEEWGVESNESVKQDDNTKYTQKIETPIYEAKNEKPQVNEVFDLTKYNLLLEKINQSDIPESEKVFLQFAATRHIVFNYEKIADYYAHSSKDFQMLMEDSALVIIDFNKAIELGYINLSDEISELYIKEYGE
jgi:hypothetical protein